MIVTTLCRYSAGAALTALFAVSAVSPAGAAPTTCDKISQDVRESVEKDPAKVLMIVEDALVINETCACEIVRAAITASKADGELVKQIVQTSIAVAPKMTAVIEECSGLPVSGAQTASTKKSGKDVVNVSGKDVQDVSGKDAMDVKAPKDGAAGAAGSRFGNGAGDIRGLYLIQPATGVFGSGGNNTNQDKQTKTTSSKDEEEKKRRRRRPTHVEEVTPGSSTPKEDEPKVD
jgi:hypothetical protein